MNEQEHNHAGVAKIVSYDAFVYNYQFQRKIPVGWYFLTRKGLIGVTISACGFLFVPAPYTQYVVMGGVVYVALSFLKTKLLFDSKLTMIGKDKWADEKVKAILGFSKISWALKRAYNARGIVKNGGKNGR